MLRYYVPEIAKIFRIEPMPRNRVQHQKGLSDDAFERLYPDEEACRKAWFAWRWPEGFKCPRCAGSTYCEIRGGTVARLGVMPRWLLADADRGRLGSAARSWRRTCRCRRRSGLGAADRHRAATSASAAICSCDD